MHARASTIGLGQRWITDVLLGPGPERGGANLNVRSRSFVVLHIIHDRLRAITQSPRNAIKFEPQGVMHSNLQFHVCLSS